MRAVKKKTKKKTSGNVVQRAKEAFRSRKVSSRRETSRNVFPDEIQSWSVTMEGGGWVALMALVIMVMKHSMVEQPAHM